jgi:hypothetical protein
MSVVALAAPTSHAAFSPAVDAALGGLFTVAAATWIGGVVTLFIVARVASRTLEPAARVAFFRGLGRVHGVVGTLALLIALGLGAALLSDHPIDGVFIAAMAVAAGLLAATALGVRSARQMTRLRRALAQHREDPELARRVQAGARSAAAQRTAIGVLTFALIALGALLAT